MHVFISYARRDQASISQLRADFERLGHRVWFDRQTHGDQTWWDDVLRNVRECAVFVFALSPDSVRSKACLSELRYAETLRRPILPVIVRPLPRADIPERLTAGLVDYHDRSADTAISLLKAFNALPMAKPLPPKPPAPPEIPTTYLNSYIDRIDADEITPADQIELLAALKARLFDADHADVWDLLVRLRGRPGLLPRVSDEIESVLAPGWQPDPAERFEARYWDGQMWTTLVVQNGQEFNDRSKPPQVNANRPRGEKTDELVMPGDPADRPAAKAIKVKTKRRVLPWLVAGTVALAGGGVTGGLLLFGNSATDPEAATQTARNFVDAVNTRDSTALEKYVCAKDLASNKHLYGAFFDTANVTLQSVDIDRDEPRFTILAARTAGNSSVTLSIPLADENGEWRVCDISKALSGR